MGNEKREMLYREFVEFMSYGEESELKLVDKIIEILKDYNELKKEIRNE